MDVLLGAIMILKIISTCLATQIIL